MTLDEMTKVANSSTDENFRTNQTMFFANEAISVVNAEVGTRLPFIEEVNEEYTALTETWIRQIIIPYISYSIKMNDSAIQEAVLFLDSFNRGLNRIKDKKDKAIGEEYRDNGFETTYTIDFSDMAGTYNIPSERYSIADWEEFKEYFRGEFVSYEGVVYQALTNSLSKKPTETDYWRRVG